MTEDEKQKVLIRIVDDDQAVREGGEFMLSCKGWKVKSYASARDFLVSDTPSRPGVPGPGYPNARHERS